MLATHCFCAAILFFSQFAEKESFNLVTVFAVMAMAAQVLNITDICQYLYKEIEPGTMSPDYVEFINWLKIEVVVFASGLVSNILFLFLRSLVIQRITLNVTNLFTGADTDFLESQIILCGLIATCVVPAGLLSFIRYETLTNENLSYDAAFPCSEKWLPLALLQAFSVYFIVFVSLFECPFGQPYDDLWAAYVPFVHGLLAILTFAVIPIYFVIDSLSNYQMIFASEYSSSLWILFFTSFIILVLWIPTQIFSIFRNAVNRYSQLSTARTVKKAYKTWEELTAANPPGLEDFIKLFEDA